MQTLQVLATTFVFFTLALGQSTFTESIFRTENGIWLRVWAVCDAPAEVILISEPRKGQLVRIERIFKNAPNRPQVSRYRFLGSEGAAGSIYYSLAPLDQPTPTPDQYYIRRSNIQSVQGGQSTNRTVEVRLGGKASTCRWFEGIRFLGVTARRTVYVLQIGGGLEYRSYDFAKATDQPSLRVGGGRARQIPGGGLIYRFANLGYTYAIEVSPASRPSAKVVLRRGGHLIQVEPVQSYIDARPR
jgi:hypothetical protein